MSAKIDLDELRLRAAEIVRCIIADLTDRGGFRHDWEDTDEEIRREIIGSWEKIVMERIAKDA